MKNITKGMAAVIALSMALAGPVMPAGAAPKGKIQKVTIQKPDTKNLVLRKNATYQLKVKVKVSGKVSKKVTYKSSNKKVVKVSSKGKLTAKKNGTAKITVSSAAKPSKKAVLTVKVGTPIKSVKLSKSWLKGEVGGSSTLTASVSPKNATVRKVAFISSNAGVAKVSSAGKVSFLKAGTANITAKAQDGSGKKAVCKVTVTAKDTPGTQTPTPAPTLDYSNYKLKWEDQFDGTALNRDDWNVELHDPGWVNNELQAYVDSDKNIYIEDGNLVLKPVETKNADGTVSYTSGRVNTQNKHDFKYGIMEARAKVPAGQGFLPAFWMMPTNENLYGQWPRCGEIDIMEVLGNKTDTSYGTIHYGNPHSESQGKYTLNRGNFVDEYHTFSVEWEPGKINWYVDGKLIHSENDWYSVTEGQGEITYPAPFDQPFYIILNLAVGGNWPGNPDATTDIEKAAYKIDYVKVYQKDSYNEDVEKPIKDVVLRDPDAEGNYINNGSFADNEDLTDTKNWQFLTTLGGDATAEIKNKEIYIQTKNAGTADYSVQLVQPELPLKKGGIYKVSFDAYADAARTMKVDVSAPDRGYKRYLVDTAVDLKTEKQTYTYEFTMTDKDDANGRLEYNLGNTDSTAGLHISNVSVVKTGEKDLSKAEKTILADGNHIYNGGFQEGVSRLGYWDITKPDGAEVSVTNTDNIRKLKVVAPEGTSATNPVVVSQKGLALTGGNQYALSFLAESETGKSLKTKVAGETFETKLEGAEKAYSYKFATKDKLDDKDISFAIEAPGTYYLDDVRIVEDSLIKNGSFNAGFTGYEVYAYNASDISYVVDSLNEDNAADFSIANTGDQAWYIQLKQNNIELEKGQWYKLSLDAKSDIDRKLMFAIQRDGTNDDDWTPYSGEKIVALEKDYHSYDIVFQMKNETDLKAVLSISMGAVDGTQISKKHRICIDNINLEKVDAPQVSEEPAGANLLKNGDFAAGDQSWVSAVTAPGEAKVSFENKKAEFDISNVGTADWNVQLKQENLTLEKGCTYKMKFKATSSAARTIKMAMLSAAYDWYGGADIDLAAGTEKDVEVTFTMEKDTDAATTMVVSMGVIEGKDTPVSKIVLSDFSLEKEN